MKSISILALLFIAFTSKAQNSINNIAGTWKGTSICQIKNSPCHDEVVVYHILQNVKGDSCTVQANKIVNGAEEEMGTLHFAFDKTKNKITSTDYGLWSFTITGKKMSGTLYHKGDLYRIVELNKVE